MLQLQAAKKCGNQVLTEWIPDIRNHFWHCAKNCDRDEDIFKVPYYNLFGNMMQFGKCFEIYLNHLPRIKFPCSIS